jgi:hypothetical protein
VQWNSNVNDREGAMDPNQPAMSHDEQGDEEGMSSLTSNLRLKSCLMMRHGEMGAHSCLLKDAEQRRPS